MEEVMGCDNVAEYFEERGRPYVRASEISKEEPPAPTWEKWDPEKEEQPGYHLRKIEKGVLGEFSKIKEEFLEAADSDEQEISIMTLVELADMYGAIEIYLKKFNMTMKDLERMSNVTRRAFESGRRRGVVQD